MFLVLAFLSSSGTSCPTLLTRGAPLLSLATFPPFCGEIAPTGEGLSHMRLITSFFNSKSRAIGRLLKIFILNKVEHLFLAVNAQPFSFF